MRTLLSIFALTTLTLAQSPAISGSGSITATGNVTFSSFITPLSVVTTTLPNGTQGVSYLQNLVATGGVPCTGNTYVWNTTPVSGSLPTGLSIGSGGPISGVPSAAATYTFVVQVQDCATPTPNTANSVTLQIVINPVTPPPPPSQIGENGYCSGTTDASCFAGGQTDSLTSGGITVTAALPAIGMYTGMDGTPAPGGTVTFSCGGNLQTAINSLTAGQTLVIPAVCSAAQDVISGNFTLPVVSGANASNWNIIETDQTGAAGFPAEHTQATPCSINQATHAGYPAYPTTCSSPAILMPQISCANSGDQSCFTANAGAHFWRLIGLEIAHPNTYDNDGNGLIDLTAGADHIIIDRSLLHGPAVTCSATSGVYACTSHDLKNGVQLQNSTNVAVINSQLYDIACPQGTCTDSHAFGGGNGTSTSATYKIFGNLISAAGEGFLSGGGGAVAATNIITPTDFEVRNNHFFKPASYMLCTGCSGQHVEFKNQFEIKNGQRVFIEGNEFENDWMGWQTDQSGYPIVIGARNQNNSVFPVVTSDGVGGLVATSGSFGTGANSPLASACSGPNNGTPGHCQITVGNVVTSVQTNVDSTHVTTASPFPAAGSGITANQCTAGLNPNAIATDIVIRFNEFRNSTNGPEFATVLSDCGDPSLGLTRFTLHDNLIQGINNLLNNASSGNVLARAPFVLNAEPATITNYAIHHNTLAMGSSGPFGNSGFDVTQDLTDTTTDGSTGAYLKNRIVQNNIGPAGGIVTYSNGIYPGGLTAGLAQQSCTPAVTGTTCTWVYTKNVLGLGQWTNQTNNTPFPSTNQTCGGVTCFPSGSAFTNAFTQYNGASGQPGYLGNYVIAPGSNYLGSATDGKDVGVSDWTQFNNKIAGAFTATTYTSASITTGATLPSGIVGVAYSQCLSATAASDFQRFQITSGSLPTGLSLAPTNGSWCITGTPTTAQSSSFTLQLIDAAQQYASKTFSLTTSSSINNNWVKLTLNASMTSPFMFDFNPSDNPCHMYVADQLSGFWLSTDCGSTWTNKNSGLTTVSGHVFARLVNYDSTHSDLKLCLGSAASGGAGLPVICYKSSDEGTTWTALATIKAGSPPTNICNSNSVPTFSPTAVASNGNLIWGGFFCSAGTGGRGYSTDNGVTAHSVTVPVNGTCPAPGGIFSLFTDPVSGWTYSGDEQCGLYVSKDNGQTWNPCGPPDQNFGSGNPRVGNLDSIATDVNDNFLIVGQGGLFRQSNSSCPYTFTNPIGNPDNASGKWVTRDSGGNLYYTHGKSANSGFQALVMRSTDNGVTWAAFATNLTTSGNTFESDQIKQNVIDGQMYVIILKASDNTASIWKTQ